jgi:hypothetical protein
MAEPRLIGKIAHRATGRARLRFPTLRGDQGQLDSLAAKFLALPGVTHAAANAVTGSIVLRHGGEWPLIASSATDSLAIEWRERASDNRTETKSDGEFELHVLLGGVLGLLALWQVTQKRVLPPALTLLMYAVDMASGRAPRV